MHGIIKVNLAMRVDFSMMLEHLEARKYLHMVSIQGFGRSHKFRGTSSQ